MNDDFMKLTNISNKYLTNIDNEAKMKSKLYSKNQQVLYSMQGELMVNDKCLTSDISGNNVYFDECRKDKNQSWELYGDRITLLNGKNKCLASDDEKLKVIDCSNNNEMQSWNIEQPDVNRSSDFILPTYKGKMVVLVDSDKPWYLNNDTTIPLIYDNKYNDFSNKCGKFESDLQKNNIEHFTEKENNKNQTHIILLLLVTVVILVGYKFMYYKK